MPPEPPASKISLPCSESGNRGFLWTGRSLFRRGEGCVAARDRDQEHGQHLAIAQVHLEESRHHSGNHDRNRSVQDETLIAWPGWQFADAAAEVGQALEPPPQQQQQRWDSGVGGVLEINILEVAGTTRG